MGLHTVADLELVLLDESDGTCDLLSFEENAVAPSGSSAELDGTVIPDYVP